MHGICETIWEHNALQKAGAGMVRDEVTGETDKHITVSPVEYLIKEC